MPYTIPNRVQMLKLNAEETNVPEMAWIHNSRQHTDKTVIKS